MTVKKVICDECGRVKAEANHWHQIGVQKYAVGIWVELGYLGAPIRKRGMSGTTKSATSAESSASTSTLRSCWGSRHEEPAR